MSRGRLFRRPSGGKETWRSCSEGAPPLAACPPASGTTGDDDSLYLEASRYLSSSAGTYHHNLLPSAFPTNKVGLRPLHHIQQEYLTWFISASIPSLSHLPLLSDPAVHRKVARVRFPSFCDNEQDAAPATWAGRHDPSRAGEGRDIWSARPEGTASIHPTHPPLHRCRL